MKNQTRAAILILLFALDSFTIAQWSQIATINSPQLNAVKFFDAYTGITVGQGGIWRSTNSGVNWKQVLSGVNLNSVSFPNVNTGYAAGDSGKIYRTIDNGQLWQIQNSGTTNSLYGTSFFNASTGNAVGQNGVVLRTTNSGSIWSQNNIPISDDLRSVHIGTSPTIVIVVGSVNANKERFGSTGNGGINWLFILNESGNHLKSVSFVSVGPPNSTIIAIGSNGRIRKSTNSGYTWLITTPITETLNCILFVSSMTGFISGNSGKILKTTNSGDNWITQTVSVTENLYSISMINDLTGWAVGNNGVILRTGIPVGINNNENEIGLDFLFQNFPNPFNPETTLQYKISKEGLVKIILYDNSGKEIRVLLNDYLRSGLHKIRLSGNDLASGVYFCKVIYSSSSKIFEKGIKIVLLK